MKAIQLNHRVTDDVFRLPCIKAIKKQTHGTPIFITWGEQRAYPTDWLVEIEGKWGVYTDEEYKTIISKIK